MASERKANGVLAAPPEEKLGNPVRLKAVEGESVVLFF
jgi:hypothetical protein